jgi:hypothetical protein
METTEACDARTPDPEEAVARRVVAPYVNGALCALDPSGRPTPDFELVRDGETTGWLEVTTGTDPVSTKQWKALEERGSSFTSDRLSYDWLLLLKPTANVRRIRTETRLLYALALGKQFLLATRRRQSTQEATKYTIRSPTRSSTTTASTTPHGPAWPKATP